MSSRYWGGALCDDPNKGCEGDYDFLCCFTGFQYPDSSNVSSFESLQDLDTILSRSHTDEIGTGNKVFQTSGSGSSPQKS